MNFTVTQQLSTERVSDILCSAFEGGSNYWYTLKDVIQPTAWEFDSEPKSESGRHYMQDYPLNPGGVLFIRDTIDSDRRTMRLDLPAIQKGIQVMAEKYPWHFANILSENDDAETGDVLLQCCLFGDVIYG